MAGSIQVTPSGVQDGTGARAVSALGPNTRVETAQGFVGTLVDQLLFGSTTTGRWIMGDQRVSACGVPTISQSCPGIAVKPDGSQTLMLVAQGDSRVRSV